ncbi:MAG: beta-galactosidase [Phycisphaeraceae bacterium]|nr:beta-galactosidase [Phycisphaeraceae bacterium]
MPQISFDAQGFSIGGRRIWLMGAAVESSLWPRAQWSRGLALLRQRGFNTIRTSAPWSLHERHPGRLDFTGSLDLKAFVKECRDQGLWVVVRIGPMVGGTHAGGGLPSWIAEIPELRPREPQDLFLRQVASWFGSVLAPLKGLEASERSGHAAGQKMSGGLLAVQVEHGWECGNEKAGEEYLTELRRFVRESGIDLPVLTANGLWVGAEETVDVWQGSDDLLAHVRQLRRVQPHGPALVEVTTPSALRIAHASRGAVRAGRASHSEAVDGRDLARRVALVFAAGGQAIVAHAAPEVHRLTAPGRSAGVPLETNAVVPVLVNEADRPGAALDDLAPLAIFASHFGSGTGGAAGSEAVVLDPDREVDEAPIVISRACGSGTVAFVLSAPRSTGRTLSHRKVPSTVTGEVSLISADGRRLTVVRGSAPVSWYAFDLDLGGRSTLDYATLSPLAFIDDALLVLMGAAGVKSVVSINGSESRAEVPDLKAGARPRVLQHAGVTVLVVNELQAAALIIEQRGCLIGAERTEADGSVTRAKGFREVVRVESRGQVRVVPSSTASDRTTDEKLRGWRRADTQELTSGRSDRFAGVEEPQSLAVYAPRRGFGWYRLRVPSRRGASLLWMPGAVGDLRAFLDGAPLAHLGERARMPLRIPAGGGADGRSLVILANERSRPSSGLAAADAAGVRGQAWIVEPIKARSRKVVTPPFDPFTLRRFVPLLPGALPEESIQLSLRLDRSTPIIIDPGVPFYGAVLINGVPAALADRPAGDLRGIHLAPGMAGWRQGSATITLVPFASAPGVESRLRLFKCMEVIGSSRRGAAAWAFARWEPPEAASAKWSSGAPARARGRHQSLPTWWTTRLARPGAVELRLDGLSSGAVLIDGALAGRFDAATDPRLPLSSGALDREVEVTIFDVEGRSPDRVSIRSRPGARSS